jgi:hypothetical protein
MSTLTRFKYIRAIPFADQSHQPGYHRFTQKKMRQIPTTLGTATSPASAVPVISAIVPGGSWGNLKMVLIRGIYQLTFPTGTPVPLYSIEEQTVDSQGGIATFIQAPSFTATAGAFSTFFERRFIRFDPNILVIDEWETFQFGRANLYDGTLHAYATDATAPPYDFTQDITLNNIFSLPGSYPSAEITGQWAEAFLEQGINLGTLTG